MKPYTDVLTTENTIIREFGDNIDPVELMDKIFYTYIHIRPDTNEPFYVGKGKGGRHKTKSGRNQHWHNIVNKNNGIFESKILFEGLSEEEALNKEIEIERELKDKGYNLVNLAETGKSGPAGIHMTENHKQALSKATKGRISPNKGKKHDPFPEESKYWKGKNRPKETKDKQSSSQSNRWKEKGDELRQKYIDKMGKKVLQIDVKTLIPLEIFPSMAEAKRYTKINGIYHCIYGRQKTAGGYIWVCKHYENPYFEYVVSENEIIRVFECSSDLGTEELWHRDLEDRTVEILNKTDWKYQEDNKLPLELNEGDSIFIPKQTFHRIYKGTTPLKIKIKQ